MPFLTLLGPPRWLRGDGRLDLPLQQTLLLGGYLACQDDWTSRDELVHLFWPDEAEKTARHNLSQLLYHCKKQPWLKGLEVERTRARWCPDSDLRRFREALGEGRWDEASTYGGTLLEGAPPTSPSYDAWLEQERQALQSAWREAVMSHSPALVAAGQHTEAARLLREVLNRDNLAEDVLQAYMRAAGAEGGRDKALAAYDTFCRQLKADLGVTPLAATRQLAETLRADQDRGAVRRTPRTPPSGPALYAFPSHLTPFIGREREYAEVTALLQDPERRLLTLLGPGGVGKTRLAVQVARNLAAQLTDGAAFVALAPLEAQAFVLPTLLDALGLTVPAQMSELAHLKTWLAERQLLIVFDNAEHLLESAPLITDLLGGAPGLRVLVTSREALDVQGESVYDLRGFACPPDETPSEAESYEALTFFLHCARRAHPGFSISVDNRAAVIRLCRLLDGMPLGLELAAAWLRLLGPADLVDELSRSIDLLSGPKDAPARQQSVRAVLEQSWQRLSEDEQTTLKRLAVFQGGFDKDAAREVAEASLRSLLSLVNKSLVYRTPAGRFERLGVVRQFSYAKLTDEERVEQHKRHAEYFVDLAETARRQMDGEDKARWLDKLAQDHDNLRSALRWLSDEGEESLGLRLANALFGFWWLRGHYLEGRSFLSELLTLSEAHTPLRASALDTAASLARLCEDIPAAKALYGAALALKRELGDDVSTASTLGNLGMVSRLEGDYEGARDLVEESLALHKRAGNSVQVANGLNNLAAIAVNLGRTDEAWRLNEASLQLANELGERFIAARSLGNLGALALERGALERALALREESLRVFEALGYRVGVAVTLQGLGDIALAQGDHALAREKYLAALRCFEALNDTRGIAEVLDSMSELMMALGESARALRFMGAATRLFSDLGITRQPEERAALEDRKHLGFEQLGRAAGARRIAEGAKLSIEAAVQALLEPVSIATPTPTNTLTDSR